MEYNHSFALPRGTGGLHGLNVFNAQ